MRNNGFERNNGFIHRFDYFLNNLFVTIYDDLDD